MISHIADSHETSLSGLRSRRLRVLTLRIAILAAIACSLGANYRSSAGPIMTSGNSCRSQHFVITAPTPQFARQVCEAAEHYRESLAMEWLGQPLPEWPDICPINVSVGPNLGAGGATRFTFINGQPRNWGMEIQGSPARVLDSVLPHEITHMVLATHLGCPLPRWADEGAATSVEHVSERSKQDKLLVQFLTTNRGIAFNHMFAMREYPEDILPLYSQGYSLARYLIAQGGKRKFVDYLADGLRTNNWTAATQKHYGIRSLSDLQVGWLSWVRQGSPNDFPAASVASRSQVAGATDAKASPNHMASDSNGLVPLPHANMPAPYSHPSGPGSRTVADTNALAASDRSPPATSTGSWYSRRRDEALGRAKSDSTPLTPAGSSPDGGRQQLSRPQPPESPQQIILQWSRDDQQRADRPLIR